MAHGLNFIKFTKLVNFRVQGPVIIKPTTVQNSHTGGGSILRYGFSSNVFLTMVLPQTSLSLWLSFFIQSHKALMNRSLCSGTQIFDLGDQKILEREVAHSPINTFNMFLYPQDSSWRFLKSMQRSLLLRIVCNENLQQDLFYGLMYSYLPQQDWAKGNVLQSIKTLTLVWGEIKWQRTGTSCSSHRG